MTIYIRNEKHEAYKLNLIDESEAVIDAVLDQFNSIKVKYVAPQQFTNPITDEILQHGKTIGFITFEKPKR